MAISGVSSPMISGTLTKDSLEYLDRIQTEEKSSSLKLNQDMGRDQFLHILLTQLANQNPLDPVQDKDFIAQMAQFSSLESMQNLNKSFDAMKSDVGAMRIMMQATTQTPSDGAIDAQTKATLEAQSLSLKQINETLKDLRALQIEQLNLMIYMSNLQDVYNQEPSTPETTVE
jgi:flagellar hook assembly protein FlgD